eukprot:396449_1
MSIIHFVFLYCLIQSSQSTCNLKEKFSVSLVDGNGAPIATESAELDSKRNAILLSTRSSGEVIRISSEDGAILDQPYISNIPRSRSSKVIGDLFYITSANSIRIYDLSTHKINAPEYTNIFPETTRTDHQYNGLCSSPDNRYLYVIDPGFVFGPTGGPSETGGVWKIDLNDGSSTEIVELGTRIQANGCGVDNDGNLFIGARGDTSTDPATATSVVYLYDEINDDLILLNFNGLTSGIENVVIDEDDNMFISENKPDGLE